MCPHNLKLVEYSWGFKGINPLEFNAVKTEAMKICGLKFWCFF